MHFFQIRSSDQRSDEAARRSRDQGGGSQVRRRRNGGAGHIGQRRHAKGAQCAAVDSHGVRRGDRRQRVHLHWLETVLMLKVTCKLVSLNFLKRLYSVVCVLLK